MATAEHQFKLARCGEDGVSLGEKLRHIENQTGKRPPELDGPEPPEQVAHLLGWFWDLSSGRGGNGFGPNPLGWADIDAWVRLTGTEVRPWEIRMLRGLDRAYLASMAKEN